MVDLDRLAQLHALHTAGALTEAEFETQKAALLGAPPGTASAPCEEVDEDDAALETETARPNLWKWVYFILGLVLFGALILLFGTRAVETHPQSMTDYGENSSIEMETAPTPGAQPESNSETSDQPSNQAPPPVATPAAVVPGPQASEPCQQGRYKYLDEPDTWLALLDNEALLISGNALYGKAPYTNVRGNVLHFADGWVQYRVTCQSDGSATLVEKASKNLTTYRLQWHDADPLSLH